MAVDMENVDDYLRSMLNAVFNEYIRLQVSSFTNGLGKVIPIETMQVFKKQELENIICGEDDEVWEREKIEPHIKTAHGYTVDSKPYQNFISYIIGLSAKK